MKEHGTANRLTNGVLVTGINEAIDRAFGATVADDDTAPLFVRGDVAADRAVPGDEAFWQLILEVRDTLVARGIEPVQTHRASPDLPDGSWTDDDLPACWPLQLFAVTPEGSAWTYDVAEPRDYFGGRPGCIDLLHPQRLFEGGISWDAERGITFTAPTAPKGAPTPPGMTDEFWQRIRSGDFGGDGHTVPIRDLIGVAATYLM